MWLYMGLIRIFTKRKGHPPDFSDPVILSSERSGTNVKAAAQHISREMIDVFNYALVRSALLSRPVFSTCPRVYPACILPRSIASLDAERDLQGVSSPRRAPPFQPRHPVCPLDTFCGTRLHHRDVALLYLAPCRTYSSTVRLRCYGQFILYTTPNRVLHRACPSCVVAILWENRCGDAARSTIR